MVPALSGLSRMNLFGLAAIVAGLIGLAPVRGEEPEDLDDNPSVKSDWTPPTDGYDWIQLKSDEWLKGEIIAMYNGKLEFDSDELDFLSFDFEDIKQIRTKRHHQVLSDNRSTATGTLFMKGDRIVVKGQREVMVDRDDVVSIAAGEPKEINYWTAKVSLGMNFRRGNQSQLDYNTKWAIQRRTPKTRYAFDYLGTVNRTDDIDTINNHRATTYFDYFYSRKFFIRPVTCEYFRDSFQNIAHRFTLGAQLGYTFVDTASTEWDVTIGPGYQVTNFETVLEGEDETRRTFTATLGTSYDQELTDSIDFLSELRFQMGDQGSGGLNSHWINTFEFELTRTLDFDVSLVWDRVQNQIRDEDGITPKKDDFRLILGIGLDL